MSVRIRLKRMGSNKRPYYRIVVMDSRTNRDGKTLDELGYYRPVEREDQVRIDATKVLEWVSKGAQVTPTVRRLCNAQNIRFG